MNTPFAKSTEDDLREQVATLRKDFARLSETAASSVAGTVGAAGQKAADGARAARASVVESVVEHPLTAVGLAAALGYLFAALTRR